MSYPPSPTPRPRSTPPPASPRANSCGLIFAFAWAAVATVATVVLLALFLVARNDNVVILTALAETSAADAAVLNAVADEATAFVLTASVTDTPTATPPPTEPPTATSEAAGASPAATADMTQVVSEMAGVVATSVVQTLTAMVPTQTPTNTPQPTLPTVAQPAQPAQPAAPQSSEKPVSLTGFVCRPALGQPNTYQILGTISNVSGQAVFVEFQAQADIGTSRNFPLSPGASWTIPEGSPNPQELIYVQFFPEGSNYVRLVARATTCPNGDCNGVAGDVQNPWHVLIEGTRDQLCQ